MKRIYVLGTLMLVLASGLFVSCETPDASESQEIKTEMGDAEGGIPIKKPVRPPVNPPITPKG
ncbi:hypothetical protein [Flavobacterium sp. JP2137]|uniref:hypothetical protein n=1 Tax=Flavobacterium sp. JP2137 TaxID=3414510 RepID=UPI003D2FA7E9